MKEILNIIISTILWITSIIMMLMGESINCFVMDELNFNPIVLWGLFLYVLSFLLIIYFLREYAMERHK